MEQFITVSSTQTMWIPSKTGRTVRGIQGWTFCGLAGPPGPTGHICFRQLLRLHQRYDTRYGTSFFSTMAKDWVRITSPKWSVLCRMGRKTLTQSIRLSIWLTLCPESIRDSFRQHHPSLSLPDSPLTAHVRRTFSADSPQLDIHLSLTDMTYRPTACWSCRLILLSQLPAVI